MEACPQEAIDLELPGRIHREKCLRCGTCASVCPGKGLRLIGTYYSVESLGEILLRDLPFYRHSDGGVTLSGGECTLYPDYLDPLLRRLKASGVHFAMQTSGYFDYPSVKKKILPYVDLIQYDIKIADPENHKRYLGQSNRRIFNNLRRLIQKESVEVHARVPLVPGITATESNLSAIIDILCELGLENVSLLPYNPMGMDMAVSLGREKPNIPERFMTPGEESEIYTSFGKLLEEKGIRSSKDRKSRDDTRKVQTNNKPASMSPPI